MLASGIVGRGRRNDCARNPRVGVGRGPTSGHQLAMKMPSMPRIERDRTFAVDHPRDVCSCFRCRRLGRPAHHKQPNSIRGIGLPAFLQEARTFGGGGGTAVPSLSRQAGLCLHPVSWMRGVLSERTVRILVPAPAQVRLSQSMSLYTARQVGLVTPLGVAMPLSWQKGSPNEPRFHFALTSEGNHCVSTRQLNPRPQALDVRIYVRSCFFVFSPCATRRAGKTPDQRR
jgi:hypothetical protein